MLTSFVHYKPPVEKPPVSFPIWGPLVCLGVDCIILDSVAPLNHHSPTCNPQQRLGISQTQEHKQMHVECVSPQGWRTHKSLTRKASCFECGTICGFLDATFVFYLYWVHFSVTTNPVRTSPDRRVFTMYYNHQVSLMQWLRMRSHIYICALD